MSGNVVVDASLIFKWLIDEEYSDLAHDALAYWFHNQIIRAAPYFMPVEVTNILHQRVKRSDIDITQAARLIEQLLNADIQLHHSPDIHRRALELASQLGQGAAYDSHYLALAEGLDCEMWTADERFYRNASPTFNRLRLLSEFVAPSA